MPPVFVDTNVAVYAGGSDPAFARACGEVLQLARFHRGACCSSAEVLQEILHVLLRRNQGQRARQTVAALDIALSSRIEPVTREDVLRAAEMYMPPTLQARDRLHLAVMERLGITRIISVDAAYDAAPGIERLDPRALPSWRDSVFGEG